MCYNKELILGRLSMKLVCKWPSAVCSHGPLFYGISPYGRRMMRQTCTMQVNLDFGSSEEMLAKRYVAANLIAPFATAILPIPQL